MRVPSLASCFLLGAFAFAEPSPAPSPRPYWEWIGGSVWALGPRLWSVEVLHGGGVIVVSGEDRVTKELTPEQRLTLARLAAALPSKKRSYSFGRAVMEGPAFHLRLDDGRKKTAYAVLGVGHDQDDVSHLRAIAEMAVFLRTLVPHEDAFDPADWLSPVLRRQGPASPGPARGP